MNKLERRKHPRVKIYYPLSFVCTDEKGGIVQQNMGVVLNISQGGRRWSQKFGQCVKL
jgi:hypothetical protein